MCPCVSLSDYINTPDIIGCFDYFMRKLATLSLATCSAVAICAQTTETESTRPNIILFMVDDMGWQDTSLPFWTEKTYYNEVYETPNMERLAQQGKMFTQAYACPISSPTRCSLITGANNVRHRVTNWTLERDKTTDGASDIVTLPEWNCNGVAQEGNIERTFRATSFVDILRRNGYHTIHCGKAHWGAIDTPGENPTHFGFEVNIAGHAAGGLATYLSELNYGHDSKGNATSLMSIPGLEQYWGTGTFVTEALTQEAIKALEKAKCYEQPFFLYMSHYAIHIPIDKDERFFDKYIHKGLTEREAAYASLIEGMDKSLGDIMDWLDENEETDNTILIFMSDNGGLATNPEWRDGKLYSQNSPLLCGKGSMHEGGIRVPMIVKWKGKAAEGTRCDKYLMIEDFYPTILDMAGINVDNGSNIDGISFMPLLTDTGDTSKDRALYWNFPNIWGDEGPGINLNCAIRKNEWKLIYYYVTGEKELYDICNDIGEKVNLANERPDIVQSLSSELGEYLRSAGGQRPSFKAIGKPCPWPDETDN